MSGCTGCGGPLRASGPGAIDPMTCDTAGCPGRLVSPGRAVGRHHDQPHPERVTLPRTNVRTPDGWNVADETWDVPVEIVPDLDRRGECAYQGYGPPIIRLREWDERVLIHEVLHVLVDPVLHSSDPRNHDVIRRVEVGLLMAGWRYCGPGESEQTKGSQG